MIRLYKGGSPCTSWSIAKSSGREVEAKGIGWELFRNYVIGMEKYKPDYFLYENNKSMARAIRDSIDAAFLDVYHRRGFAVQRIEEQGHNQTWYLTNPLTGETAQLRRILINSGLVSAQNRQRYYWTNIPSVELPEDMGILLRDILETGVAWREKAYTLDANYYRTAGEYNPEKQHSYSRHMAAEPVNLTVDEKAYALKANYYKASATNMCRGGEHFPATGIAEPVNITSDGKAQCLRATYYKDGIRNMVGNTLYAVRSKNGFILKSEINPKEKTFPIYHVKDGFIIIKGKQYPIKLVDGVYIIRKLTVTECKRLQTVPDSYVFPVSDTQAYKMLGNGWTVDVIAHILSYIPGITAQPVEVVSMYDGMSCGHIALDKLGADVVRYYATEIDKYAIKTTKHNYPDTVQLGDAFQVREDIWFQTKE